MAQPQTQGYVVILVVQRTDYLYPLLVAWHKAGVPGVTILKSAGMYLLTGGILRDDQGIFISSSDDPRMEESPQRTLFAVVPDEATVHRLAQASKQVVGDFRQPNTGIFVAWPVIQVLGLEKERN